MSAAFKNYGLMLVGLLVALIILNLVLNLIKKVPVVGGLANDAQKLSNSGSLA